MIRFLIALVAAVNIAVVTMADERSRRKVRLTTINQLLNAEISVDLPLASRNFHIAAIEKQIKETYDVNFPLRITIQTRAVQRDGITQNARGQSFCQQKKPVADVLTALVVKWNPANVKSPADPDQRLVWVVGPDKSRF